MMTILGLSALELLRILCGIWFLPHLIGKVRNFEKASGTFERAGLKPGKMFLVLTLVLEALALVGLTFDIYPKAAAACGVVVLLGAAYAVVRINGFNWRWQFQGPEYPLFWAIACALTTLPA
jgi:putative oxidoreductase